MAGTSHPRLTALDRPALGLVMQIAALITFPTQLSMATVVIAEDVTGSGIRALVILQLIAAALQLAAGIAIARRSLARPLVIAYGIATLAVAAAAAGVFAAEEAPSALAGAALEVLAGPLVILVAPLVLDLDRLADRRSPADAAAALCVLAVGSLIAMPVGLIDEVRLAAGSHASATARLGLLPRWVPSIATAIFALRAARALLRPGPPAAAGATAVAVALLGIVLVWLYALLDLDSPGAFRIAVDKPVWPLAVLIAMLGTLAWSQRRRPP